MKVQEFTKLIEAISENFEIEVSKIVKSKYPYLRMNNCNVGVDINDNSLYLFAFARGEYLDMIFTQKIVNNIIGIKTLPIEEKIFKL